MKSMSYAEMLELVCQGKVSRATLHEYEKMCARVIDAQAERQLMRLAVADAEVGDFKLLLYLTKRHLGPNVH